MADILLGTTNIATESGGTVTLQNSTLGASVIVPAAGVSGTLGSNVVFPAGHVIQTATSIYEPASHAELSIGDAGTQLGTNLQVNIQCASMSNQLIIHLTLPGYDIKNTNRSLETGMRYDTSATFAASAYGTKIGTKDFPWSKHGKTDSTELFLNINFFMVAAVPSTSSIFIRPYMQSTGGSSADVYLFSSTTSEKQAAYLMVQEIQG